jgi:hypothetical protein
MNRFERPIPGQSLTTTPKNAPYERPPEISDPELAIQMHLARLTDPEVMEEAMFHLEMGLDVVSLTEGILRSAVMAGIHSIDVSLIAAPVIHEYIKSTADSLGVEYEEGLEDKEAAERTKSSRNMMLAKAKMDTKPRQAAREMQAPVEAPVEQEMPEEAPRGLMARRA